MKNRKSLLVAFLAFFLPLAGLNGQTSDSAILSHFKVTAELVSNYVWRGSMATGSPTPNFQPTLAYTSKMFEIGVWGSTDFAGSYKEVDPYVAITAGLIKVTFTDYNWNLKDAPYFNYHSNQTGHRFEGSVGYTGPASFPLSVSWNTMFYGLDKKPEDGKQAYSTYIELGYAYGPASFFFGLSPWGSLYTAYRNELEVVNIGVTLTKALKITKDYSLPLRGTLVVNPSGGYNRADYVHLIFGITF
jgi:hypothetical protein